MKTLKIFGAIVLALMPAALRATTINLAADTYVSSSYTALNFGNNPGLQIGNGNSALIALDLSSLPAGLTAANIQKATITVYVNQATATGSLDVSQVTSGWSETGVTFASHPATASQPFLRSVPVNSGGSYVTFDITALFIQWLNGSAANYGLEITPSSAQPGTTVVLDSKESTTTSHAAFGDVAMVGLGPAGPQGATGPTGAAGTGSSGPQGPQGPPGPSGPAGLAWEGPWSGAKPYTPNDVVAYGGTSWQALSASSNILPGSSGGGSFWAVLAVAGATGPQGIQGTAGARGLRGAAGPQGPIGRTGLQGARGIGWHGEWNNTITYNVFDAVMYGRAAWLATAQNQGVPPSTGSTKWTLMNTAGTPTQQILPGQENKNPGISCNAGYITGFFATPVTQGETCTLSSSDVEVVCPPLVFQFTTTSYSMNGEEYWPHGTLTQYVSGNSGCGAQVWPPGLEPTSDAGNPGRSGINGTVGDCKIDHTNGPIPCAGWNYPVPLMRNGAAAHGYCTMQVLDPNCGSLAAIGRLDGAFPACSVALSDGNHSTASAIVTCSPDRWPPPGN